MQIFISHEFIPLVPFQIDYPADHLTKGLKRHPCLRPHPYWKKSGKPNPALAHDLTCSYIDFIIFVNVPPIPYLMILFMTSLVPIFLSIFLFNIFHSKHIVMIAINVSSFRIIIICQLTKSSNSCFFRISFSRLSASISNFFQNSFDCNKLKFLFLPAQYFSFFLV